MFTLNQFSYFKQLRLLMRIRGVHNSKVLPELKTCEGCMPGSEKKLESKLVKHHSGCQIKFWYIVFTFRFQ